MKAMGKEKEKVVVSGVELEMPVFVTEEAISEKAEKVGERAELAKLLNEAIKKRVLKRFEGPAKGFLEGAWEQIGGEGNFPGIRKLDDAQASAMAEVIDVEGMQEALDALIEDFEIRVGKRATGGETVDPVKRKALQIATEAVMERLAEQGIGRNARSKTYRAWDAKLQEELGVTAAEYIADLAEQLLAQNPEILEAAKEQVEAQKALASAIKMQ